MPAGVPVKDRQVKRFGCWLRRWRGSQNADRTSSNFVSRTRTSRGPPPVRGGGLPGGCACVISEASFQFPSHLDVTRTVGRRDSNCEDGGVGWGSAATSKRRVLLRPCISWRPPSSGGCQWAETHHSLQAQCSIDVSRGGGWSGRRVLREIWSGRVAQRPELTRTSGQQ